MDLEVRLSLVDPLIRDASPEANRRRSTACQRATNTTPHENEVMAARNRMRGARGRRFLGSVRRRLQVGLGWVSERSDLCGRAARRLRSRLDPHSLPSIAQRSTFPIDRALGELLVEIEDAIAGVKARRAAILVDERSIAVPAWLGRRWPKLKVLCLTPSAAISEEVLAEAGSLSTLRVVSPSGVSARHCALTAYGKCDIVIDTVARPSSERLGLVRDTLLHLRRGGCYLTVTERRGGQGGPDLDEFLARAGPVGGSGPDAPLMAAIGDVRRTRHSIRFVNTVAALPKLRYYEMDQVLSRRPGLGRRLSERSAVTYASKSVVTMNRDQPPFKLATEITVPALGIREYNNVLCAPYQVLIAHGILLTDTYRHYLNTALTNGCTKEMTDRFARYTKTKRPTMDLTGPYFYLGSEVPQHFGHVMTEQLSRLWAWPEVKDRYPTAKALVDVRARHDGLKPYEFAIFSAAGVAPDDLIGVKGPVRVETLIAAAPMLVNTQYVHPDIVDLWSRTAENLAGSAPARDYPDKIFVSRRDRLRNRQCTNAAEVEAFFVRRGFTVIYPEDYSMAEQVMLFRQARVVAGFAGSGMFTLCFCAPKKVIMIWPDTYTSRNEFLICSVIGHDVTVFWCATNTGHPAEGWDAAAYQSSYAFDFVRDKARLAAALDGL